MADFTQVINRALGNIGIAPQNIADAMNGGELYGGNGILDSLDFVRFISELTQLLESVQLDLFELVERLDSGLAGTFQSVQGLAAYLAQSLQEAAE